MPKDLLSRSASNSNLSQQNANPQQTNQQNSQNNKPMTLQELYEPYFNKVSTDIYQKTLVAPIRLKVLDKFGVGRSALFRSKELNAFRDILKEEAREQARNDIRSSLDENTSLNKGQKAMHAMNANVAVHKTAKKSVDNIMEEQTDEIINSVLPSSNIVPSLKAAAQSAFNENDSPVTIDKKVLTAAQKHADTLYEMLEKKAIHKARMLVKGEQDQAKHVKNITQLSEKVKQNVTEKEIGKEAIKASIEAPNFNSALTKIAPLIKQVVPFNGDSAELSFEIKIPIPPAGFISIHLGTSAEHDDNYISLGAEVNIGGGGMLKVAELKASIGLFIEAKGKDEMSALNLMSYGMYRHMYVLSPSLATTIWGNGEKSGFSKLEEAEVWAAAMEQKLMEGEADDESEVSVGQQVAFDAAVKTEPYEGNFQIKGQRKTTYNRDNLQALNDPAHVQAVIEKKNKLNILERNGIISPNPKKGTYDLSKFPDMKFGEEVDFSHILHTGKGLGENESLSGIRGAGKESLRQRAKRYKEIEAKKSVSVSTDHTVKLPHGEIELGAGFTVSGSEIEGEISFGFPEKLEKLGGDKVFNHLFPKITSIANSGIALLQNIDSNDNEIIKDVNQYEGAKLVTTNAVQSLFTGLDLEDNFDSLHSTNITGSLSLKYDFEKKELEVTFKVSKDTAHEIKAAQLMKKVGSKLEVVNFNYSKSSKIFEKKITHSFA